MYFLHGGNMNKKQNKIYEKFPIFNKGKITKNENSNKSLKKITFLIILIIIVILLTYGYSMAKTIEQVIIKSEAKIAEPIFVIENDESIKITNKNNNGIYNFKIKNYDINNNRTETDLKYYIEILSDIDDSINIELYENDKKINLYENKTEYLEILKDEKKEKKYKVKIMYKDNLNIQEDIVDKINIIVHAEQINM